ncbi:MAG TPA: hypothetical protein P5330_05500, partial [Candidatus Competibacteraceae bacterium]|nr:hypothetical protein [Candidatus Competibacteraceae bacterium]
AKLGSRPDKRSAKRSAYLIYLGEDLNGGSTIPLSSFSSNAIAAQSSFLSLLNTPIIENSESFPYNETSLLKLTFANTGTATFNLKLDA